MSKKYASKAENFNIGILPDKYKIVRNDDGDSVRVLESEGLVCDFQSLVLRGQDESGSCAYARAVATRHFFPQSAWRHSMIDDRSGHKIMGALPSSSPQGMFEPGPGDTQRLVGMTSAYDPTMHFGYYDTAWIPDAERRAKAEAGLDSHGLKGTEYIEIIAAALPAPWPTYDTIGQGATLKIPATVKDLGLDPLDVYAYEAATKNREGVLTALQKLADDQNEAAVDEAALSRSL